MNNHLSMLDYSILVVYMAGTVALGLWFTRKQKTVETYFVADRSVKWWAVGISVIASHLSAISYLGGPAWLMEHDLQLDVYVLLAPLMLPIVAHLFLPFLARLRVISIYEYLEHRFGIGVRTFGSGLVPPAPRRLDRDRDLHTIAAGLDRRPRFHASLRLYYRRRHGASTRSLAEWRRS